MTPDQRDLVLWLACLPGGRHPLDRAGFARRTGIADPTGWACEELRIAIDDLDSGAAELALVVGAAFGVDQRWVGPLIDLVGADWHRVHEEAVSALASLHDVEAVPALYAATQWVPDYLGFDEDRGLARKAIHALGAIPDDEATRALEELLRHEDDALAEQAGQQLDRRLS